MIPVEIYAAATAAIAARILTVRALLDEREAVSARFSEHCRFVAEKHSSNELAEDALADAHRGNHHLNRIEQALVKAVQALSAAIRAGRDNV